MKEKQALQAIHNRPLNRAEIRKLMHRQCPCRSGKLYKNCCMKKDLMKSVRKQVELMKERDGFYKRMEGEARTPYGKVKISKGGEKE